MAQPIKKIAVNGAELGYSIHGTDLHNPPLIFVHGYSLRSTAGPYEELLSLLSKHFSVYALDLRGHGASVSAVDGWTHAALADDAIAFAHVLKLDRPILAAHSFGAFIGLLAAIRHPDMFSSLCLLSPGPADPTRDPVDTLDFLIKHGHEQDKVHAAFEKMFIRPPGRLLDITVEAVTLVDAQTHRAQREENLKVSIDNRLKEVATPVLLMCGKDDTVVPLKSHHDMAGKLPHCKEVVFSREGHMLPSENARTAAVEIINFAGLDQAR